MGLSLKTGDKKDLEIVIVEDCEITRMSIKLGLKKILKNDYSINFTEFDNFIEAQESCKKIINNILEGNNYFILLDNNFYSEKGSIKILEDAGIKLFSSIESEFIEKSNKPNNNLNLAFISADEDIGEKVPKNSNVEIIPGKGKGPEYITLIYNWILNSLNIENQ